MLVKLDTRQEEAQLAAAEAAARLARLNLDRMKGLRESGVIAQADYDRAAAELKQDDAKVGEIRATIERKTIRAPFSGVLGIRQVNLGQYLAAGAPIVPLQTLHPDLRQLRRAAAAGGPPAARRRRAADGRGAAESSGQDHRRRLGRRSGHAQRPGAGHLRQRGRPAAPGHVRRDPGRPRARARRSWCSPPRRSATRPYGDSVFVVEDVKGPDGKTFRGVRQQFVKLGGARGDQVAVLSGLKPGEEVVTSGVFKLRNGAAVQVNNQIQPANSAHAEAGGQLDEADRSLHPPAGPGDRRQPGDPDRRPAVDPLAERPAVPAQRRRGDQGDDRLRGRQRRPGARLHHHAARAGDRQRRRHRLHGVVERAGREHDHRCT